LVGGRESSLQFGGMAEEDLDFGAGNGNGCEIQGLLFGCAALLCSKVSLVESATEMKSMHICFRLLLCLRRA
jgi:hypothetical protein